MATWNRWFNKDFRLTVSLRPSGLALAALFAVLFLLLRQHSVDQWYLPAGLRVAALLLFPIRLWPYLIVGETSALLYLRLGKIEQYGLTWVIVSSITVMPAIAGIVYLHKRFAQVFRGYWFLSIAAAATVATPLISMTTTYLLMPPSGLTASWERGVRFAVGEYLGILMLAPLALLWNERQTLPPLSTRLRWDAPLALAAILVLAMIVHLPNTGAAQADGARVLMAIPAIVLTCLHGWRGAVIGVTGVNFAVGLTMNSSQLPGSHDDAALTVQLILATAGTALLVFGSAISLSFNKLTRHLLAEGEARQLAKSSVINSELQMKERAARIRSIGDDMDASFQKAVKWLRQNGHHAAAMQLQSDSVTQTRMFREQLSLIYPSEIELHGLYAALRNGAASRTWEQSGRLAPLRLTGEPFCLSLELQLAAYRSICDAVAVMLEHASGGIQVRTRCGKRGDRTGIAISVRVLDAQNWLTPETMARVKDALNGRVMVYGGKVKCRRNQVCFILRESTDGPSDYGATSASMDQVTPSPLT